jgi:transketolase
MCDIDTMSVNALRILSADMVEEAKSGHPGMPLGIAPMTYELWAHHMQHNPKNPKWVNRDRFVLSAGHASVLLYSLLHLFGYGLTLDDLRADRSYGSRTPGHPEYGHTVGVEATTGPLGAGMGAAVGMAMAEAHLAAIFNKPEFPIVDHYTYVLGGDGCMMEGVSSEAFSLAGTLGLAKLIVFYDSNKITIEGSTDAVFTENVQAHMAAGGFQTITVEDGNDLQTIANAIEAAKLDKIHPSFITVKTKIAYGCPAKQGKASSHGSPLGAENVEALKKNLHWGKLDSFYVPDIIYDHYKQLAEKGMAAETAWNKLFTAYSETYPESKKMWDIFQGSVNDVVLKQNKKLWEYEDKPEATRVFSGVMLNRLKDIIPNLFGGSADLSSSNKTRMDDKGDFSKVDYAGRNVHFGIREMAMGAIANGLALHGGLKPYVATYFVFSDYMKPMIRLAALMKLPITYVFTHDSIGVGEDGPTHEPVEQLGMLRSIPNLHVFRPADATETAAGWSLAMTSRQTPTALVLSRQKLPQLIDSSKDALKGGYIIADAVKKIPDGILIASGSEVFLALQAKTVLVKEKLDVRVVSMPCMDLFEKQSEVYKESVLPSSIRARVAIEAGTCFGWKDYTGLDGAVIAMKSFGASGASIILFEKFGFTVENIVINMKKVWTQLSAKNLRGENKG